MSQQLCNWRKTEERLKYTDFWPTVVLRWGFPKTSSKRRGWPKAGWLADVHHTPLHMQTPALRASYSCWKRNSLSQFPSPNPSSDSKQNKTILATLFQGTAAYWKMPTWAKNSIHGLHVIRATHVDFSCCMLRSLLRATIIVKHLKMLDDWMACAHGAHLSHQTQYRYTGRCWPAGDLANSQ